MTRGDQSVSRRTVVKAGSLLGLSAATPAYFVASPKVLSVCKLQTDAASNSIVIGINGDIDTTDHHVSQLILYTNTIRLPVFSSLIRYGITLDYLPDLAESWESPDELTYVFRLREGARYHTG